MCSTSLWFPPAHQCHMACLLLVAHESCMLCARPARHCYYLVMWFAAPVLNYCTQASPDDREGHRSGLVQALLKLQHVLGRKEGGG